MSYISRIGVGVSQDCFSNEEGLLDLVSIGLFFSRFNRDERSGTILRGWLNKLIVTT